MPTADPHDLVLDRLTAAVKGAAMHNPDDADGPAAILWADQESQWLPIINQLRTATPGLLTLADYDPDGLSGPPIWLRCAIDGALDGMRRDEPPVVYLPAVSRQQLGSADTCPDRLKPLVEIQYRGVCWTQKNGKDWTVEAFLTSADGGLGLEVARDAATRQALRGALRKLANTSVSELAGRHIDADFLNSLLTDDPVRDVLQWLNDADITTRGWDDARRAAFKSYCSSTLAFDPDKDGVLVGAELLGRREAGWAPVWQRFAEAPTLYPKLPDLLQRATPQELFVERSSWPQNNASDESGLRKELRGVADMAPVQARETILSLERSHAERRGWVWAKLGQAPLAFALEHLAAIATRTSQELGGSSTHDMAKLYAAKPRGRLAS